MDRIKAQFESYQKEVIPQGASETQVRETRRAFFAGAQAMMTICQVIATDRVTTEEGAMILDQTERELLQFKEDAVEGRA